MKQSSLHTRKRIDRLSLADLEAFPVWEFATAEEGVEGQDETWVQPLYAQEVPTEAYSLSVAAEFKTPAANRYRGIVGVTTAGGLEVVHAAIITKDNYIFIPWPGFSGAKESCRVAARELGLAESELFPLEYELVVPVRGDFRKHKGTYSYGRDA